MRRPELPGEMLSRANTNSHGNTVGAENELKPSRISGSMGDTMLKDSNNVEAGHLLMRDTWNMLLLPLLAAAFNEGLTLSMPDVWFNKGCLLGMSGNFMPLTEYLKNSSFTTLLFTSVNASHCILSTMQDEVSKR